MDELSDANTAKLLAGKLRTRGIGQQGTKLAATARGWWKQLAVRRWKKLAMCRLGMQGLNAMVKRTTATNSPSTDRDEGKMRGDMLVQD